MIEEPFILSQDRSFLYVEKLESLFPWVCAGFSIRKHGVSQSPYDSLNVGLHVGDRIEDVIHNRQIILSDIGYTEKHWVSAEQTHGSNLYQATRLDQGSGFSSLASSIPNTDALYTNEANLLLVSFYADCVPLYILDVKKKMVGIAHAGWKGTASQIGLKLIREWQKKFATNITDLRIIIGPSIGECCYEVDGRVIHHFKPYVHELSQGCIVEQDDDKYLLHLKQINYEFFIKAGVPADHIEVSRWCTSCYPDLFFSYRRDAGRTGRMLAFIGIKEEVSN